uniref:Ig-like domain-containing protein n=1 Tax=Ficedula albicollis TaxID=59894 RepID=A0A803VAV2_FICAL
MLFPSPGAPCQFQTFLSLCLGVSAQAFSLHQPQDKVPVAAGETLTLNCTVSSMPVVGSVRWLKGWGSENKTIYDQRVPSFFPRVTRAVDGSDTDFTIHIRNVQPEDMGTYYCVKYTKEDSGEEVVFRRGNGTEVSVQGEWAQRALLRERRSSLAKHWRCCLILLHFSPWLLKPGLRTWPQPAVTCELGNKQTTIQRLP